MDDKLYEAVNAVTNAVNQENENQRLLLLEQLGITPKWRKLWEIQQQLKQSLKKNQDSQIELKIS